MTERPSPPSSRADARGRHPHRARGRELALLALCHLESYRPEEREQALEVFWKHAPAEPGEAGDELRAWLADERAVGFARRLLTIARERAAEIDAAIEATSRSWRLSRMDRVDRNALRLVAAEGLGLSETPRAVIVAEAVRLAARYGSERSAPFVNGVAQALTARLRGEAGS
ncbi:MAG TPA: transcription antitermination factor NusB [Nannocystis sp.]